MALLLHRQIRSYQHSYGQSAVGFPLKAEVFSCRPRSPTFSVDGIHSMGPAAGARVTWTVIICSRQASAVTTLDATLAQAHAGASSSGDGDCEPTDCAVITG
jgi:hypothetical protein